MKVLVASDNYSTASRMREILDGGGCHCPADHMVELADAVDQATRIRPDAVVLGLSPDPDRALPVLGELQEIVSTRILAVGPASDPQLILRVLRDGAFHYLDETQLGDELKSILRRSFDERIVQRPQGRIIVIMAPSGGSGASTLAVNIATALSGQHSCCALLDLRIEAGDLATLLNLKPVHTLSDFCDNADRMDDNIFDRCFAKHSSGVSLLAAPHKFADTERVTVRGVRKALAMARKRFAYVVVDAGQAYRPEQAQAILNADTIVMVMRPDILSLRQARRSTSRLEELGIPPERISLVANRYGRHSELRVRQVEKTLGTKALMVIADDPKNVRRANIAGIPLVVARPYADVARSIHRLAMSVNGMHVQISPEED